MSKRHQYYKNLDALIYRKHDVPWVAILIFLSICLLAILGPCSMARAEVTESQAVQCILGEARNEYFSSGYLAFLAVADALRNRNTTQGVYGCAVNLKNEMGYIKAKGLNREALRAWRESARVNLVKGAKHWESVDFEKPYWAKNMKVTYQAGKHRFYK